MRGLCILYDYFKASNKLTWKCFMSSTLHLTIEMSTPVWEICVHCVVVVCNSASPCDDKYGKCSLWCFRHIFHVKKQKKSDYNEHWCDRLLRVWIVSLGKLLKHAYKCFSYWKVYFAYFRNTYIYMISSKMKLLKHTQICIKYVIVH